MRQLPTSFQWRPYVIICTAKAHGHNLGTAPSAPQLSAILDVSHFRVLGVGLRFKRLKSPFIKSIGFKTLDRSRGHPVRDSEEGLKPDHRDLTAMCQGCKVQGLEITQGTLQTSGSC